MSNISDEDFTKLAKPDYDWSSESWETLARLAHLHHDRNRARVRFFALAALDKLGYDLAEIKALQTIELMTVLGGEEDASHAF